MITFENILHRDELKKLIIKKRDIYKGGQVFMSIATEFLSTHKPEENTENNKKLLIGECVAQVLEIKYLEKEGKDKLILFRSSVIHPVARDGKDDDNIEYGDEITKFYGAEDEEGLKKFGNDMFTAGIEMNTTNEQTFESSMLEAVNKLVYFSCWSGKFKPKGSDEEIKYNAKKVLSKNKITEENSTPLVPF